MKHILYLIPFIASLTLNGFGQKKPPVILKSRTDSFTYSEIDHKQKYTINNGDTMAFGTNYYDNVLKLSTETDSIAVRFNPKLKPFKQSTLVHISSLKAKQTVYLHFNEMNCWFTNEYLTKAQHKVQYHIPETYELANVLYALTRSSDANSNRTLKGTPYYSRMLAYFKKYKNHPLIKLIEFPDNVNGSTDYYNFRDNSFCFMIKDGKVVPNNQYYVVWGELKKNLFAKHLALVNDFYHKTNFHRFFESNRSYYDSLIRRQQQLMPARKMWLWLEKNFDQKIQSYRNVLSPLINGSHGTQIFYWIPEPTSFFSEAIMFTSGPRDIDYNENLTEKQKEGMASAILFTEIDHNYCNPVSQRYQAAIDSAFSNREKWILKGGDGDNYPSSLAVFNEYITHAVYLLYAFDNFKEEDFAVIKNDREKLMVERRRYIKFREFSDTLLKLYKGESSNEKVKDLFPRIIEWCKTQN